MSFERTTNKKSKPTEKAFAGLSAGMSATLEITAYGSEGQGIARHNGMAVFVPGAMRTERVTAEITKVTPSFAEARLLKILQPSAERVDSLCPYYAACGGCDLLHMSYAPEASPPDTTPAAPAQPQAARV